MPYLQLDVSGTLSAGQKRELAQKLCNTYADAMQADIRRINVAVRELGPGSIWRMLDGELREVSVLTCDIRRGRAAEVRMEAAQRLVRDCVSVLGIEPSEMTVEFTQHSGDEMYHPALGGYSPEWKPGN
jgi:phenylpyruvate tautomerase PptA (4-oxalocrotonate tautomerase family)